ncbi:MAG: DinB family protein [Acidobacteria bacterium]|nr:DinB family protein [Acidobacteriota bacterium]MCA1600692.1 DinB family protein [Acidobacteriota bacterium]
MTKRIKWIDRRFDFTFPTGLYPEMIERLRGTPARLEDRIGSVPAEVLLRRDGEKWSMQENAGHLLDLEALVMERLDQYLAGATELHAADMSNRKTYEAGHNSVPVGSILSDFRQQRMQNVARLDGLDAEMFARSAFHPRLAVQMRLVDMIFFQAEHDDYHLARISELARLFAS